MAQEIVAVAAERRFGAAAIDLDWLGWASGSLLVVEDLISHNLAAVAANYREAGIERLVLARALVAPSNLLSISRALPDWLMTVVMLRAPRSTIEKRIRARDSGAELADHLRQIDEMMRLTNAAAPDAQVVINDGDSPRAAALEVIRLAHWDLADGGGAG